MNFNELNRSDPGNSAFVKKKESCLMLISKVIRESVLLGQRQCSKCSRE